MTSGYIYQQELGLNHYLYGTESYAEKNNRLSLER